MVQIIPVEDKLKEQRYCLLRGVPFDLSLMSYAALKNGDVVGLCQFGIFDNVCRIQSLAIDSSIRQSRIPIMLMRAVINFSDTCDVGRIEISEKDIDGQLALEAGFEKNEDLCYRIHLREGIH